MLTLMMTGPPSGSCAHGQAAPGVDDAAPEGDLVAIIELEYERLAIQIERELELLGFKVYRVPPGTFASSSPEQLEEMARVLGASAVLALTIKQGALRIWVIDRVTNKFSMRKLKVPDLSNHAHVSTVALQAVELLRVSLTEVAIGSKAPRYDQEPADLTPRVRPGEAVLGVIEATLNRRRRLPSVRPYLYGYANAAFEWSAGSQGLVPRLELGMAGRVAPYLDLSLHTVVPVQRESFESDGSGVDFFRGSVALGVIWFVVEDQGWNVPLSGRVGVAWTTFEGQSSTALSTGDGTLISPVIEVRTGIQRRINDYLAIRAGVTLGTTVLPHEIEVVGRTPIEWGVVIGRLDLGLEFGD